MFEAAAGYSLYAIAATDETDLFLSWTVVGFGVIILAMLKPASALVTIVFFATSLGSIQATTIAVTASGTGTSLDTLNSVELQVLSTADVVFAFSASGGASEFDCNAIDQTQPAICNGQLDQDVQLGPVGALGEFLSEISYSGTYQYVECDGQSCGGGNNIGPFYQCNGEPSQGNSCSLTLGTGTWFMSASLFDSLVPANNATVTPFSESVTATLTVNSGSVQIITTPEPRSLALLLAGCTLLAFLKFKRLTRGPRQDPEPKYCNSRS